MFNLGERNTVAYKLLYILISINIFCALCDFLVDICKSVKVRFVLIDILINSIIRIALMAIGLTV